MDSQLSTFMTLSGFAAASLHLGDQRPAWIWARDGKTVLWANPAGAAFFGVRSLAALSDLSGHERAPARPHIMRVAESGPVDRDTTDRLRFYRGLRVMLVTCSCRRITLPGGESGALIVALDAGTAVTTPLSQALVDLVSGGAAARETSAIVFDAKGQVAASSSTLGTPDFDDVSRALRAAKHAPARAMLSLGDGDHASVLLMLDSGETLVLLDNEAQAGVDETAPPDAPDAISEIDTTDAIAADEAPGEDVADSASEPEADEETVPDARDGSPVRQRIASATGLFAFASATRFLARKEPAAEPVTSENQEASEPDAPETSTADATSPQEGVSASHLPETGREDTLSAETLAAEEMLAEELLGEEPSAEEAPSQDEQSVSEDDTTDPEATVGASAEAHAEAENTFGESVTEAAHSRPLVADDSRTDVTLPAPADFTEAMPVGSETDETVEEARTGDEETVDEPRAAPALAAHADDDFVFEPRDRAIRFAWKMDVERRFTFLSPEFEDALGPLAADIVGKSWDEIAERFEIDTDGRVAAALKRRDTWSGRTVLWPVSGHALRVPVDMAALPAFDRQRVFEGFRGFGVCRTGEAETDPEALGIRLAIEDTPAQPEDQPAQDEPQAAGDPDESGAAAAIAPTSAADGAAVALASDLEDAPDNAGETPEPEVSETPESDAAEAAEEDADDEAAVVEPEAGQDELEETEPEPTGHAFDADDATVDENDFLEEAEPEDEAAIDAVDEDVEDVSGAEEKPQEASDEISASPADAGLTDTDDNAEPSSVLEMDEDLFAPAAAAAASAAAAVVLSETDDDAPRQQPEAEVEEFLEAEFEEIEPDDQQADPVEGEEAVSERDMPDLPASMRDDTGTPVDTALETSRLSKPERDAFRKIAEALGARTADEAEPEPHATDGQAAPRAPERAGHGVVEPLGIIARPVEPAKRTPRTSLLDKLPVGVAIIADDTVIYANTTLLTLSGYANLAALQEAGGLDALFAEPEDWPSSLPGSMTERTMRLRLADGGAKPVKARLHSVEWNDDTALMMSLVDRHDPAQEAALDRLHEVQTALALSEEQVAEMDAVLETATDGVLILDENGAIVKVNRSAEALFNASRDEMNGAPLINYLAPESHRDALDYLDGLARNGVASVLNDGREVIGQVGSGGLIPLFMTIGRVGHGADGPRFCTVLRDITQWKKAEEELTDAKRQAESASSKKSDFLAKISHEIRTPLNAIIGFSEVMMEERFGPVGNDRYKGYLRDIHNSGSHIMSLINDLLDLSKIEAGKLDLTFEAVCANDIIRECVALMQPQANRERVIIRASLPTSVPKVVADGRSVRQIVLNLLSNAIKFNQPGGQVIVSTALEDSGEVILRVRDTGLGMSNQDLAAAMEPFRQLHTARHGGGTGLGLPLTKALVEANRASFRIDSELNHGTLIEITFPPQRVLAE
ncbi:MAG: PAS domain-containing sensor histidine kinase [Stappia sp.]|uniref:ATP-binding protein n=1 Tax=Stappia sp. TaxID=1870903 RepID=UPI000C463D2A|nr:ATP-binding protein [Stappia sp.]MAB00185.1 PAS domain-containing sensor histidine kinase [Stappia sp.]MBM21089.1 PAS domain-containing sensor histidine kinase [Stappia sp.]